MVENQFHSNGISSSHPPSHQLDTSPTTNDVTPTTPTSKYGNGYHIPKSHSLSSELSSIISTPSTIPTTPTPPLDSSFLPAPPSSSPSSSLSSSPTRPRSNSSDANFSNYRQFLAQAERVLPPNKRYSTNTHPHTILPSSTRKSDDVNYYRDFLASAVQSHQTQRAALDQLLHAPPPPQEELLETSTTTASPLRHSHSNESVCPQHGHADSSGASSQAGMPKSRKRSSTVCSIISLTRHHHTPHDLPRNAYSHVI